MTQKEINNKIKNSLAKQWFKTVEVDFNLSHLEISVPKKGFTSIYQFIARQKRGWDKITNSLPAELQNSKNHFTSLLNTMDNFLINNIELAETHLPNIWNRELLGPIRQLDSINFFTYDSPITSFLLDVFNKNTNYYIGAYQFLFNKSNNFSNSDELTGAFMAYEFKFQESSNLPKRSRFEKSSNSRLRNAFEKYFTKVETEVNEFYNTTEEKVKTFDKSAIKFFKDKNKKFETWLKKSKDNEGEFNKYTLNRVKELENLYSDKLMLAKPAEYWNSRATKLNREAERWLIGVFLSIGIAVVILIILLSYISNGTLENIFSSTGTSIKFSIGLLVIISFLAFAVRTFSKLSFSAYHLARDAEERKQLVYVYLALKQEKAVEERERILILQSIFSRADSGLLKEDSSPTMPASVNIMDKIMTKG